MNALSASPSDPFSALVSLAKAALNVPPPESDPSRTPLSTSLEPPSTPMRQLSLLDISLGTALRPPDFAPRGPHSSSDPLSDPIASAPELLIPELASKAPLSPNRLANIPHFPARTARPLPITPNRASVPFTPHDPSTGPAATRMHHSNRAPYFSGQIDESIEDFLQDYKELADNCRLTEQQRVEKILRYVPATLRDLWKTQDGFTIRNWAIFRQSLECIYCQAPERARKPPLLEYPPRDSHRQPEPEMYCTATPTIETKSDICERSYAILYARCIKHFPHTMQDLPRPLTPSYAPTTTLIPTANPSSPYLKIRPRVDGCAFCTLPTHRIRDCPTIKAYINFRRELVKNDWLHSSGGEPIPNDSTGRGLQGSIYSWLAAQYPSAANTPASVQAAYICEAPPPAALTLEPQSHSPSHIEEIIEPDILQTFEVPSQGAGNKSNDNSLDTFEVFAAEKKQRENSENRTSKLPELSEPTKITTPTPPNNVTLKTRFASVQILASDHTTMRKSIGLSPFYMAHGIEPILPFDITLAMFLIPDLTKPPLTTDLIAACSQLEQHPEDLEHIHERILKSRFASVRRFERHHEKAIQDFSFKTWRPRAKLKHRVGFRTKMTTLDWGRSRF